MLACRLYNSLAVRMRAAHKKGRLWHMAESLPALIARRQKERGASSLRALYSLAELGDGGISYETLRRLSNGEQRGSRDPRVPRDLAVILGVSERIVREALAMEPDYGMWELPPRAQGLDARERDTVERVIDAILEAKRRGGTNDNRSAAPEKIDSGPDAGIEGDNDAEVIGFPPGEVPSWARDVAAHHTKRPKGTTFGNQDPGD